LNFHSMRWTQCDLNPLTQCWTKCRTRSQDLYRSSLTNSHGLRKLKVACLLNVPCDCADVSVKQIDIPGRILPSTPSLSVDTHPIGLEKRSLKTLGSGGYCAIVSTSLTRTSSKAGMTRCRLSWSSCVPLVHFDPPISCYI